MKKLLRELGIDAVYGVDFETFWSQDYTLKKLATTDYVYDERFEMQLAAVQSMTWAKPKVMEQRAFASWAKTIDWKRAAVLCHHAHFDGLILHRHFGVQPAFFFDTLSMARPTMPITVPKNLDGLAKALGLQGKIHGDALVSTKGKRWSEFSKEEKAALKVYAGDDISDTWAIFRRLIEYVPLSELRLIDTTVKLYTRPKLLIDKAMMQGVFDTEVERKRQLLETLGVTAKELGSDEVFASLLRDEGVDPPVKWSDKQHKEVYAFAKNDQEFKDLLEGENEDVAALVEARLNIKSKMVESRAERLIARSDYGPQPIYLNYWGAGPGRWSGGDRVNWQNLKRGSNLRKAIHAPPGCLLVIADLAQIEARVNAWFSGQDNVIDIFREYDKILRWEEKDGELVPVRAGPDVYNATAALLFGKPIDQITTDDRFFGKTCVIGLGYGAGAPKFHHMLQLQAKKGVVITESFARDIHRAWRQSHPFIVSGWKQTHNKLTSAFVGKQIIEDKCVAYEGAGQHGFMHLPSGMSIRYDNVEQGDDLTYIKSFRLNVTKEPTIKRERLYGGLEVENRTQALARIVVSDHALAIADALKDRWQLVMTTHDELVGVVPARSANRALKVVKSVMSQAPSWAPGLPIAVDAHISQRYDK